MKTTRWPQQLSMRFGPSSLAPRAAEPPGQYEQPQADADEEALGDCQWSTSVALDPKHRPQVWDQPASTVRREWCRYPQEAHLLDEENWRYRRLTADEIAILQGFEPSWFQIPGMTNRNRIRAIGDAVPPPLARAIVSVINQNWSWKRRTAVEICAGSGGLGSGAAALEDMEHLALVDQWPPACEILRHDKPWRADRVHCGNVKEHDFSQLKGRVGFLSGGPPCQPWSIGGRRKGFVDPRDLLAWIHELVGTLRPEVFAFENVPGLVTELNAEYLTSVLSNLRVAGGRRYGVVAGVLNAADYGLPQIRRRVIILGFRDMPTAFAHHVFDKIGAAATHRDPHLPGVGRARWRTLRDVLGVRPDPGGWRKWIDIVPERRLLGNRRR